MLTRRLQILVDEEQFGRLEAAAHARNGSIAAAVRDAVDLAFPSRSDEKRRAAKMLLSAPQLDLPDVAELKVELEAVHSRHG